LPVASDALAGQDYLVTASLDGGDKASASVRLAAPVSLVALRAALAPALRQADEAFVAPSDGSVRARRTVRLGSLILSSEPLPAPKPAQAAPLLLSSLRARGMEATLLRPGLPTGSRARELIARVALLRALHGPAGGWPVWSEASLSEDADLWLEPALARATGMKQIQESDLASMLAATLDAVQRACLQAQAPTRCRFPLLLYEGDEKPAPWPHAPALLWDPPLRAP
jgi:ATP-dependent helicase HrpB